MWPFNKKKETPTKYFIIEHAELLRWHDDFKRTQCIEHKLPNGEIVLGARPEYKYEDKSLKELISEQKEIENK